MIQIAYLALAALLIRWIYAVILFAIMGESGLTGPDSIEYLATARIFADSISSGSVHGWAWLGPYPVMMPLFTWLLTSCVLLFGSAAPLGYVLIQGFIDSATCLLIVAIAQAIAPRYAMASGIAGAINPTQIVLSAFVYSDSVFVFFCALFLFSSVRWLQQPSLRWALLIGFGLGAAAMCRILIVPWSVMLMIFLFAAAVWLRSGPWRVALIQLVAATVIVAICVGTILARNIVRYDAWSLTPQGGLHLALWVVPLVKEAKDGTIWAIGSDQIKTQKEARFGSKAKNIFEESKHYSTIAKEILPVLGIAALAKAWVVGAGINLVAPAVTIARPVAQLPRTGFYGTPGDSTLEKIGNYLFRSDNALYAWIVLAGVLGVLIMRLLQLVGVGILMRDKIDWSVIVLFGLWIAYILAINGPIASPKYRLPIEPIIVILTAIGFCTTRDWLWNQRAGHS